MFAKLTINNTLKVIIYYGLYPYFFYVPTAKCYCTTKLIFACLTVNLILRNYYAIANIGNNNLNI